MQIIKIFCGVLLLFLTACSSVEYPKCVGESTQNVVISWGEYDSQAGKIIKGYAVKSNAVVYDLENLSDSTGREYQRIADTTYCKVSRKLKAAIMKTQTLNVPADTIRFIRYSNLKTNYNIRAFWNNKLKAIGSKEFREVFDILNSVSPSKFEK